MTIITDMLIVAPSDITDEGGLNFSDNELVSLSLSSLGLRVRTFFINRIYVSSFNLPQLDQKSR
jgi:hypothetical protein